MRSLAVEHNLSKGELAKALVEISEAEGVSERVCETLLEKAHKHAKGPIVPRNPAYKGLYEEFQALYAEAEEWSIDYVKKVVTKPWQLRKAKMPTAPLTKTQLERIQTAIRDKFKYIASQMEGDRAAVSMAELARWKKLGLVAKNVTPSTFGKIAPGSAQLIRNAFVFGRLSLAIEKGTSYESVLKLALEMPLIKPDLAAIAVAEARAGAALVSVGDGLAKKVAQTLLDRERDNVRDLVISYFDGMEPTVNAPELYETPEKRVDTWQGFARELRENLGTTGRDWDRVAFSEIQDAASNGRAMDLLEKRGGDVMVMKIPQPTACPQCIALYLNDDGTPRVFPLRELMANGSNIGRKPMPVRKGRVVSYDRMDGAQTVLPVVGQVHPWCQCEGPVEAEIEEWF